MAVNRNMSSSVYTRDEGAFEILDLLSLLFSEESKIDWPSAEKIMGLVFSNPQRIFLIRYRLECENIPIKYLTYNLIVKIRRNLPVYHHDCVSAHSRTELSLSKS